MASRATVSASTRSDGAAASAAVELIVGDANVVPVDTVEPGGELAKRDVPTRAHLGEDGAHRVDRLVAALLRARQERTHVVDAAQVQTVEHGGQP